jgi:hypothetical protein
MEAREVAVLARVRPDTPEREATPEDLYLRRRELLALGAGAAVSLVLPSCPGAGARGVGRSDLVKILRVAPDRVGDGGGHAVLSGAPAVLIEDANDIERGEDLFVEVAVPACDRAA